MTIRKELNYQMEIFWSGVKAVQVEKILILAGLRDPGGWNRSRKKIHETLMDIFFYFLWFSGYKTNSYL